MRENEFEKIMNRQGMGEMMRPLKYIAQIHYPNPENPTILEIFRTAKARDEWYQMIGKGAEFADVGVKVEFTEGPAEDDEKFYEDDGK